jgi:hypothetical protein
MTNKRQRESDQGSEKKRESNLGQKEAQLEREKNSELCQMGEKSRDHKEQKGRST